MNKPDVSSMFKVENYGLDELLTIFGIESPIKKEAIMKIADNLIDKYTELGKPYHVEFFSAATNKLLSNYERVVRILGKVEDYIEKVEETTDPDNDDKALPDRLNYTNVPEKGMGGQAPQLQKNLSIPNTYSNIPFVQGSINPTLQNEYTTWLNVDSQYREILPRSVDLCIPPTPPIEQDNKINQRESSTDFTVSLANPITNVLAMTVGSIELSLAGYYAFSDIYGNTTFQIQCGSENHCYKIPEGNYTALTITKAFNVALNTPGPPPMFPHTPELVINQVNQKAYIYCPSGTDCSNISFIWGNKNCCGSCDECCDINDAYGATATSNNTPIKYKCSDKNRGKKLNSTLGWALGFREHKSMLKLVDLSANPVLDISSNVSNVSMIYGSSVCNLFGSKYFILEVDDFNRNRNNGEMATMTMPSTTNSFALPTYAKNVSQVYPICDPSATSGFELFNRPYRKGPSAAATGIIGDHTLTKAQKYTAREIRNTQTITNVNQYFSPQASNILFRFPVQRLNDDPQVPIIIQNNAGMDNGRKYFGPVTIEKLKVRLLDDKGYPADLHNGDISFSLLLKRLYQY